MESKNIRPKLSRITTANYVRALLGTRACPYGGALTSFVQKTAKLAEDVFRSRYPIGHEVVYKEVGEQFEVIWHTVMFSMAQRYAGLTHEEIMEHSYVEIAGNAYLLNPDIRQPMDSRVLRYTNALVNAPNLVKIAALSRVLSTMQTISEDTQYLPNVLKSELFELAWLLKEFRVFTNWSIYTAALWNECSDIANAWYGQGLIRGDLPKPSLHYSLDDSIRVAQLRQIFED